jgi:hypothetical protein
MRTLLLPVLVLLTFSACVSEGQRYTRNAAPHYLSPRAKRLLSTSDQEHIARMIAHVSRKPILAISGSRAKKDRLVVTVGYKQGTTHDDFGFYDIEKKGGQWTITLSADSLDPLMVGWAYTDP